MDCGAAMWVALDDPEGHAANVERVGICGDEKFLGFLRC